MSAALHVFAAIAILAADFAVMYLLAQWWGAIELVKRSVEFPRATSRGWLVYREAMAAFFGMVIVTVPLHALFIVVLVVTVAIQRM